ncbi:MAG: acetate/propionate family kinase [Solirubrobacterales bacterium]
MEDLVLVLNAGSSSVKFAVYAARAEGAVALCGGQAEGLLKSPRFTVRYGGHTEEQAILETGHDAAVAAIAAWLRKTFGGARVLAVGHRVVHGGDPPPGPTRVDDGWLVRLDRLVPQMPLHLPHNIAPMRILMRIMPQVPQVACFDTWFHRTMPRLERLFAIPRALIDEGVRRYGFHGLSYEYVSQKLREVAPAVADKRVVIAHLGSGASMCAIQGGHSVATTMGFTGLDGLPMGTRSGSIDPGILLYLMNAKGMNPAQVEDLLYRRSGLLGLSGISNDMQDLLKSDVPAAAEAVDFFVYRICRELGSLTAVLGGLDALVFTGGIGERSDVIRGAVCRNLAWLGITLDEEANRAGRTVISGPEAGLGVLVVPTDENQVIADHTLAVVAGTMEAAP